MQLCLCHSLNGSLLHPVLPGRISSLTNGLIRLNGAAKLPGVLVIQYEYRVPPLLKLYVALYLVCARGALQQPDLKAVGARVIKQ